MAGKNNKETLTIQDVLNRKKFFEERKNETRTLYVKSLDANIIISKPTKALCMDIAEMKDDFEANKYFVYEIIKQPNLKEQKLQEEFGCLEPYDIVDAIFEPGEVASIANEAMNFAGFYNGVEVVEDLKN